MEQLGFLIDTGNCVGCRACEIACKNAKGLGVGPRLRQVQILESGSFPDLQVTNISLSCMHCGNPACMAVCPTGAISKNSADGVVTVDDSKCIGCHYCFFACPFGIPTYSAAGTMVKCDLCADRRAMGLEPACVQTCFYDALHAGSLSDLATLARERTATSVAASTAPSVLVVK
jgi:anaerobic dimethyl sulfoxide reductase subunit B (iron-sulfur subunit)